MGNPVHIRIIAIFEAIKLIEQNRVQYAIYTDSLLAIEAISCINNTEYYLLVSESTL